MVSAKGAQCDSPGPGPPARATIRTLPNAPEKTDLKN